jgi:hypothetical protein
VIGYSLVYGDLRRPGKAIREIGSYVTEWRSSRDAHADWRQTVFDDLRVDLTRFGVPTRIAKAAGPNVGSAHAFVLTRFALPGNAIFGALALVLDGRYALDVDIFGASRSAVRDLATTLVRRLDKRLHDALAGRLYGRPPRAPAPVGKPGPPAEGLKPAALAIPRSGIPRPLRGDYRARYIATIFGSSYLVTVSTSPTATLYQEVNLDLNPAAARYDAAILLSEGTRSGTYGGAAVQSFHLLHLQGVGEGALAEVVRVGRLPGVPARTVTHYVLLRGKWLEWLTTVSREPFTYSDDVNFLRPFARRFARGLRH